VSPSTALAIQEKLYTHSMELNHENWDGTGYPDRLKGNEIPLYARIITIADVYDAITSPRVYRPNPISKPLQTMEKEVGKKFDEFLFRKYATKELEKMNK